MFQFFFCLLIGLICPPAIPFIADYDESKYSQKTSNDKEDVSKYSFIYIYIRVYTPQFWNFIEIVNCHDFSMPKFVF